MRVGETFAPCVRHLDAEGVGGGGRAEREPEVAAGDAAVGGGVRREFGDDLAGGIQREFPGTELLGREQAGEAGTAWRGGEKDGEVAGVCRDFGCVSDLGDFGDLGECGDFGGFRGFGGFLIHVTQRGCAGVP